MGAFPNWKDFIVTQKRTLSGCIPTGYEMLLRVVGFEGVDYDSFQDDFDLDKDITENTTSQNSFKSVAELINHKYPFVHIEVKVFPKGQGREKLYFVEDSLRKHRLVLISLNMNPFGQNGWHIMPVVDIDETKLTMVYYAESDDQIHLLLLSKDEFVQIHEQFDGGDDVAYLI
jgi:hypothetical protein